MARQARLLLAEVPHHILQCGNNRQPVFLTEEDYRISLTWLFEAAGKYDCRIYAYVSMPNRVHPLASGSSSSALSQMMKHFGARVARHVNRLYRRSGPLWEGRFKANAVEAETYFLRCCRYMERAPVRARRVAHPRDYRWSSYRFHAEGLLDTPLSIHDQLERLGSSAEHRREAYRELCDVELSAQELAEIRDCVHHGWPLGSEQFKDGIEKAPRRGRPPKK